MDPYGGQPGDSGFQTVQDKPFAAHSILPSIKLLFLAAYTYALWMLVLRQPVRPNPAAGLRTDGDDA